MSNLNRPDYIKCVRIGDYDENGRLKEIAWCGRNLWGLEWAFTDAGHATLTVHHGGFQVPCAECVKKICDLLTKGAVP